MLKAEPCPVNEVVFNRPDYSNMTDTPAISTLSTRSSAAVATGRPDDDIVKLLRIASPNAVVLKALETTVPVADDLLLQHDLPAPTFELLLHRRDLFSSESPAEFLMREMQIDELSAKKVEELTRGQGDNPMWYAYRKGRITASNVGLVVKCLQNNRLPSATLLKQLLGNSNNIGTVRAIQWGRNNESTACKVFEDIEGVKVQPCGIFLHHSGILGASPDGRVSDEKIIEIKCPYSARNDKISDMLRSRSYFVKCLSPGVYELNTSNQLGFKYFHQVQANLHLTGAHTCAFVVWSPKETLTFTVNRSEEWSQYIPQMLEFYRTHILPKLLSDHVV